MNEPRPIVMRGLDLDIGPQLGPGPLRREISDAALALARARREQTRALAGAKAAAIRAAAVGIPRSDIAAKLGVSRVTIRNWLGK